jgi:nucleotide-binding universal stress UspA family protein
MAILCGTDLSAASGGALEVAVALARLRGDVHVELLHVVDPELGGETVAAREEAVADARSKLAEQVKQHAGGFEVKTQLTAGAPVETLVEHAAKTGADLIVVAARSTSSTLLRLGSTSGKLIAHSPVPVIVVRDPAPWLAFAKAERPLRVMLGIDDSASSDLGIQWTKALRALGPVEVLLGEIYYPDEAAEHYGLPAGSFVDRNPVIEGYMERDLLRRYGETKGVVARPRRGLGRIGDHVVELARDEKADVIVLGTSQKTGLGSLGSVSEVVVDDAPQSVVCVPPMAKVVQQSVPQIRSALVATDLSQFANRAVAYAFAVVDPDADCQVHVVHVVDEDKQIDEAAVMRALYELAPVGAVQRVAAEIVRGDDAATAIAQCAARLGVDVICIASHGRSGITRALVGSVADRLLRRTRLPVLVLRPR